MADTDDQRKVNKVGTGAQGFVQDPVAADVAEGDAAQLVLAEIVGGDWPGAQRAELVTPEYDGLPVHPEFNLTEASSAGTKGLNDKTIAAIHARLPSRATKQPA